MIHEGWKCESCKFYNDLLTSYCRICNLYKPFWITDEYQARIEIRRGIFIGRIESYEYETIDTNGASVMTPQEELFAKFFSQEKVLVKDMDTVALREHRDELAQIAFEAKARLVATDDEVKERSSKSKSKEWILPVDESQVNNDAINVVKTRASRMNKIERLRKQLEDANLDDATIKEMMKNIERKATEKDVKAITFKSADSKDETIVVETNKPNGDVTKVFDPSSLFNK